MPAWSPSSHVRSFRMHLRIASRGLGVQSLFCLRAVCWVDALPGMRLGALEPAAVLKPRTWKQCFDS
jgi:hypothetical protein